MEREVFFQGKVRVQMTWDLVLFVFFYNLVEFLSLIKYF